MQPDDLTRCAQADLMLVSTSGEEDSFLFEYSRRVVQSAHAIANLPSLRAQMVDLDRETLSVVAWYHAAGWAARVRSGEVDRQHVLLSPLDESLLDEAALLLVERLDGLLAADCLNRAARAVRSLNDRSSEVLEVRVVAEARALEEFGLLSLWPAIRRSMLDGRGVQAFLDTWRRKHEYQFWPARLKDAFQFDEVRQIARGRLGVLESFMAALDSEHNGDDLFVPPTVSDVEPQKKRVSH